ncbi:hypothetical protein PGT21_009701 [Puccinia graminis f. sp. tritici]|uniref:Uncharacterized protein n=1 Tax=Puccinia graminis f. sp. tritici TaxID=56615 RepID=A0A5B0QXR4_PUCGR|nr:hypothetical protein PGT21_009701 [Puccinia graminis f. sp. tritici]
MSLQDHQISEHAPNYQPMAHDRYDEGSLQDPIDIPSDSDDPTNTSCSSTTSSAYGSSPQPIEVVNLCILTVARVQELVRFRRRLRIIAGQRVIRLGSSRGRRSQGHRAVSNRAVLALRDIERELEDLIEDCIMIRAALL